MATPNILLVDDDPDVLELVSQFVVSFGYRVKLASNGAEALAIVEDHANLDLLITDVMMPDLDGFTLARLAKIRQPLLKIIYISGYSAQLRDVGEIFGPLLPKPFRSAILKQAMSEALST
jgi:two-component system cell cycle sensor histidine kinase/response regulator CckA